MVEEDDQHITCIIKWNGFSMLISSVYAKYHKSQNKELWDSLREIHDKYRLPWYITGDFNCIVDPSDKKEGILTGCPRAYLCYSALWIVNSFILDIQDLSSYGVMCGSLRREFGKVSIGFWSILNG